MSDEDYDIFAGLTQEQADEMHADMHRYHAAAHAMQSGVAFEMSSGISDAHSPKHLRVGVNSAMVENGTVVRLLIDNGFITWPQWFKQLADDMEREVKMYEQRSGVKFG